MNNLDYGVIGNCTSAALVSKDGSIDWCCLPYFDSVSFFAHILDDEKGGNFAIEPQGEYEIEQEYVDKTNILSTRFSNAEHAFEILDFMPRYKTDDGKYHCPPQVVRYIRHLKGKPTVKVIFEPRPVYAKNPVRTDVLKEYIKVCTTEGKYESIYLYSDLPHNDIAEQKAITIENDHFLSLNYNQEIIASDLDRIQLEMERTKVYWMGWVAKTTFTTDYHEDVQRSSLLLKLLSFQKTGAIIASVTTSIPETIGDVRNWDYRFCWLRDASMTISIMTKMGHHNMAQRFLDFILNIVPYKNERVHIMYTINHQTYLKEKELYWLKGYANSKPIRIGNAAFKQKQNDIYGILMDVIYQSIVTFHNTLDNVEELWTVVRTLIRHVNNNWHKLDSSIWEFRTDKKHFVFSKILCWVAMDRAVKIAKIFHKKADADNYAKLREEIRQDILDNGVCKKTNALVQYYGSDSFDSANLLAEPYGFLNADDPIYINTVKETYKNLAKDNLMYRYKTPDDFGMPKSSFTVCTFWMVKALHRIGEKKMARDMFDELLKCSNHVGLFSEDIEFDSKRLLGNFPQGYSHLALIDTAMTLSGIPDWYGKGEHFWGV